MSGLSKLFFNCIKDYDLISEGDKILVGLSGGKDSFSLLELLAPLQKRLNFELFACHIALRNDLSEEKVKILENFTNKLDVRLYIKKTNILDYIDSLKLKKDICFLCAHHRRKELFMFMEKHNIRKLALGHHKNDAIETFLMNIFYSAQTCTMMPKQSLFKNKIEIIRPMYTMTEKQIISFSKTKNIPVFDYDCGNSKVSKRAEVKKIINELTSKNRRIEHNIFRSMHNINLEYLPVQYKK